MIKITKNFQIVSEESAQQGDFEETGEEGVLNFDDVEEAIDWLESQSILESSSYPVNYSRDYLISCEEQDIITGNWITYTYHIDAHDYLKREIFKALNLI